MVVPWAKNSISPGATPRAMKRDEAVEHAERRVLRRARHLLDQEIAARLVEQHEVGVGSAHVDAEPVARRALPLMRAHRDGMRRRVRRASGARRSGLVVIGARNRRAKQDTGQEHSGCARSRAGHSLRSAFLALSGLAPSTAAADPVADFYRGKSISMIIATAPGGDYDLRARLVARHIGRHIPGNPAIVPRNMPGGVGIQAANYMANVAPQDGTSLHAIMQNMSTPPGARRRRRRIRHPQILLDRQHHRYAEHDQLLAYHRHQARSRTPWRGSWSSARPARRRLGLLSEVAERAGRHQVQDRLRLSRRQ